METSNDYLEEVVRQQALVEGELQRAAQWGAQLASASRLKDA